MLLAGDIGGTKTVLALFSPETGPLNPGHESTFPSKEHTSLGDIVEAFLADKPGRLTGAAFGVAGPVVGGRVRTTNLPWTIEADALAARFDLPTVNILNDLEAIATAVPLLQPDDLATLHAGDPLAHRPIVVVAPGTGLGEAYLTWDGRRYIAHPSEGGHSGFAPETELEVELLNYMRQRFKRVSYERVCSGMGIPYLYAFLRDSGRYPEPAWLAEELAAAPDPAPVISRTAIAEEADIAVATMELFVAILASEAGNAVLKLGAYSGVYLGGGIPPQILPLLKRSLFVEAFTHKGRFASLLGRIPVHVIMNSKAALVGAARYGLEASKDASPDFAARI